MKAPKFYIEMGDYQTLSDSTLINLCRSINIQMIESWFLHFKNITGIYSVKLIG